MPKIETRGVGLLQYKVETTNAEDDPEAFVRAFKNLKGPEQVWADNEASCIAWLRRRGIDTESDRAMFFALRDLPEDSALFLAIEWLRAYRKARAARERGDIFAAMLAAEEMGVVKERTRWRCGIDPETGARREALALQTKSSRLALAGDSDGGRASANAARHDKAEEWREVAREVAAASPVGGAKLEERILAELERRGFPARSGGRIREAIKGIRRR